jgi:hypothetical protein
MLCEIIVNVKLIKLLFTLQKSEISSEVKRCKRRKMKCLRDAKTKQNNFYPLILYLKIFKTC